MEPWEKEINRYLAPFGAIFNGKIAWQEFRIKMREQLNSAHLPLYTEILLHDGMGCMFLRIASLVLSIVMPLGLYFNTCGFNTCGTADIIVFVLIFATVCIPGFWMWWYRLMPQEKRIEQMIHLLKRKSRNPQHSSFEL